MSEYDRARAKAGPSFLSDSAFCVPRLLRCSSAITLGVAPEHIQLPASPSYMGCVENHDGDDNASTTSCTPHCFMADSCFKVPASMNRVHYVRGRDLAQGDRVFAADGQIIEVKRISSHETGRIIELLAGDQVAPAFWIFLGLPPNAADPKLPQVYQHELKMITN